jgi:two-component system cell cycle sensor histidine kinase/response regulator CckA
LSPDSPHNLHPALPAATPPSAPSDALELLAAHAVVGFFDLHFKADRIHYSPAWKNLLGYSADELADPREVWRHHIHPEDSDAAPYFLGHRHSPGTRHLHVEFRMRHRDGHYVWLQCTGLQQIGPDGELARVTGFCLDVTERHELEEASLANDTRLQELTNLPGPLGAFEFDFIHHRYWVAPAWSQLLGHAAEADPAKAFRQSLPADVDPELDLPTWFAQLNPGAATFHATLTLRSADAQPVPVLLGAHRTLNRKNELTRILGFISALPANPSEHPVVPEPAALAARPDAIEDALMTTALATLAEAVLVTDAHARILISNPAATCLLRRSAAQITGAPLSEIFRLVRRDNLQPGDDPITRALSGESQLPLIHDQALAFADAATPALPIIWTARACTDQAGQPRGFVLVFRDPAAMSLTPDELIKANRHETISQLTRGLAHDFNDLLTSILGGIALARDAAQPYALADAESASLKAKSLTQELLLLTQGGTGTSSLVPIDELFAATLKLATVGSTATVTAEVSPGTASVRVDRGQILQVLQNLVLNALQAMPPAPHPARVQIFARNVTLVPEQIPGLAAGPYVEFEIRDNGTGIAPTHLQEIWSPFFTTKKHGTGLGLATARSLVQKHGGVIGVDSTPDVGTVFTFYLPCAEAAPGFQAHAAPTPRFRTGRILFMDDDEKISAVTAAMFHRLDYKFDLAKNGDDALALYQRYLNIGRPYDAVILDLHVIGGMGGEACYHALKQIDPDARVIASSGTDDPALARRYLDLGFCGYLNKPYRLGELGQVLKTVLG